EDEVNVGISGGTTRQVCLGFDSVTVSRTLRKFAFVLEDYPGDDYVILQVLADPWQILDDINSQFAKRLFFPHTRKHEQLWAIDSTGSQEDFLVGHDVLCHTAR